MYKQIKTFKSIIFFIVFFQHSFISCNPYFSLKIRTNCCGIKSYYSNFDVDTRNNEESLFEVQYAVSSAADQASDAGMGLAHPYASPWGCCGFYQPSQNLVNAYKTDANGLPLLDTFNDVDVKSDQGLKLEDPYKPSTVPLDPRLDHTVGKFFT